MFKRIWSWFKYPSLKTWRQKNFNIGVVSTWYWLSSLKWLKSPKYINSVLQHFKIVSRTNDDENLQFLKIKIKKKNITVSRLIRSWYFACIYKSKQEIQINKSNKTSRKCQGIYSFRTQFQAVRKFVTEATEGLGEEHICLRFFILFHALLFCMMRT